MCALLLLEVFIRLKKNDGKMILFARGLVYVMILMIVFAITYTNLGKLISSVKSYGDFEFRGINIFVDIFKYILGIIPLGIGIVTLGYVFIVLEKVEETPFAKENVTLL